MNFKDKNLIIFDFDGTLINSIPDLTLAVNKMLKHYKASTLTIEEVTPFIGNGAMPLVKRAFAKGLPEKELTELFLEEAFKVYIAAYEEELCKDTFMYPGVLETLNDLKSKGYKLAICTNKPYGFIEPILDKLEIKAFFDLWVGEDSLPEKKPHALPLHHLVEAMQTTVENSIMVGDSKNDILAAQNAKMDSIGVSYGYNYNENIADYHPTVVVDTFAELQNLL
ncbi:phosphoglycolate phosphatase [Pseudotamlana carrageenivorans]|uniref:Phosphoglycolate phosphatase n=1 Tax=Pseudotamlana carrageenivorans TaxID=2069432 RepID=A0A2I7SM97_9FLAO|nr:phosphoglycolate phosphatase [Tamlana carrageenivorans]AUS07026.1 phosphoglycolate phosphatase [Tamlana carrageenivorans]